MGRWNGSSSSTEASSAEVRPGAPSARWRPLRARHPRPPRVPAESPGRPRRLRQRWGPPCRALVRRRDHAPRGRSSRPPAGVAHSHRAISDGGRAREPSRRPDAVEGWSNGPPHDPEAFLRGFLQAVGSDFDFPSPLPPELEQSARTLIAERGPWEAEIPLTALADWPFPKLVVSGAHNVAFDAICDVLERELRAERAVLFNGVLADFIERATLPWRALRRNRAGSRTTPRRPKERPSHNL